MANESDTQGTISIPQGVIVNHVKIPEFQAESGLKFSLSELKHGTASAWSGPAMANEKDFYLSVKVKVKRESGEFFLPLWHVSPSAFAIISDAPSTAPPSSARRFRVLR